MSDGELYLSGHDEAGGSRVNSYVSSHQSHILELLVHLSVFLITQSFNGAGEDHSLFLPQSQSNGVPTHTHTLSDLRTET